MSCTGKTMIQLVFVFTANITQLAARMLVFKIVLAVSVLVFYSNAIINPYGPTVINDFAKCINNIIRNEFKKSGLIVFANTENVTTSVLRIRNEILKNINKKIKFSVEILSPRRKILTQNEIKDCIEDIDQFEVLHVDYDVPMLLADYFVIIIDDYKDFSYLARRIIRSRSWNPYAKFIILLFNLVDDKKVLLVHVEKILNCLFKYNAINVVIAIPQENNYRMLILYSWKPYDPPNYCGYFNETAKNRLIEVNICERGALKLNKKVFENKIPSDMSGCVLNVLALQRQPYVSNSEQDANLEKVLVNRILKRYKMTAKYQSLDGFRGERERIGKWDGGLHNLSLKQGHVLLGGIFPDFDVHEDFECSTTYLADAYTWVVPRAPKLPRWISLIIIFTPLVWFSALVGLIVCAATWSILGQLCGDSLYNKLIGHCFLNTWISFFGFVSYKRPIKQCLRVFFVFLNIYSVLLLTTYQTKLFDMLTNPSYEYQIQTVEELIDSGLKWGGSEELHGLFINSSDPFDYDIGEQWINVHNITEAMINVAVYRNFSILCSRLELNHIAAVLPDLSDSHGNVKYFAFQGDMFSVPIEIIALRGFPFMEEFTQTIRLFKQSGLNEGLRHWYAAFNERRRASLLRFLMHEKKNEVHPLSIQHLQGGFLALILGWVGGIIILLIEIVMKNKYVHGKFYQFNKIK